MFSQPAAVCLRKLHPHAKRGVTSDFRFTRTGGIKPKEIEGMSQLSREL